MHTINKKLKRYLTKPIDIPVWYFFLWSLMLTVGIPIMKWISDNYLR